jgi:thioredoxin 1
MTTVKFTDNSFDTDVLQSDKPVVVDFWAEWCGPCKMISPILEEMASELDGHAVIGKMNIDDNPETPAKFGVRSIPTLMLFKNGELLDTKTGVQPKSALVDWVKGF